LTAARAGAPDTPQAWAAALGAVREIDALKPLAAAFAAPGALERIAAEHADLSALREAWDDALWRAVRREAGMAFALDLLDLPPAFDRLGWLPLAGAGWRGLARELDGRIAATPAGEEHHFRLQLARLLTRALAGGPGVALAEIARAGARTPKRLVPREIGHRLHGAGWHDRIGDALLEDLRDALPPATPGAARWRAAQSMLNLLAFDRGSSRAWTPRVFERLVLPWLRRALAEGDINLALQLENRAMKDYAAQTETSAHHDEVVSAWLPDMLAAGRALRADPRPAPPGDPPSVGFVLVTSSVMAHTQVLLGLLHGIARLDPPALVPRVYVMQMTQDELPRRLDALGVAWTRLDERDGAPERDAYRRLVRLREALRRDRVDVAAFVSTEVLMPFAFAMRIAPAQVWFSWKYHGLRFPEIDGYITGGSLGESTRMIDGNCWRTIPGVAVDLYDPGLRDRALQIRQRFPAGTVVLGSINRPEKVHTEPFLDALARILRANPGAVYLWFGRRPPGPLLEAFRARGIADRCLFQGWVDPRLYAQVLDVHLDTFPFPAGLTHIQAMAAGTAGVLYLNSESRQNGILQLLWPVLNGETGSPEDRRAIQRILAPGGEQLFVCARDADEYVRQAQRLIDDEDFRRRVGAACRAALAYLVDDRRSARAFAEHIRGILQRTKTDGHPT
jgi:glycosyltransferase involved in cell wall biosynthesis